MGINFNGLPWGAVSQTSYRRKAKDSRHTRVYRIHFAALGWANQIGHSDFKGFTLAEILAGKDGKQPSRQVIDNEIRKAKELGLICPSSNARCLVLPWTLWQKSSVGSRTCAEHRVSGRTRSGG